MKLSLAVLFLALVGCSRSSPPAIPPTAGDFVRNDNGAGTARVFGIDFRVTVDASGASTTDAIDANLVDGGQSTARKRFSIGDDVTIQLDSVDASVVRFTFNEQDYGTLSVGDQVVIDAERQVEVNGAPRSPNTVE